MFKFIKKLFENIKKHFENENVVVYKNGKAYKFRKFKKAVAFMDFWR